MFVRQLPPLARLIGRITCWGLACCLLLFQSSCIKEESLRYKSVYIGLIDVPEGRFAFFNDILSNNAQLALAQYSKNAIISQKNTPVRIQFVDIPLPASQEAPKQTLSEAIKTYGAQAIIGGSRSNMAANIATAAEEFQIPLLIPTTAAPEVADGNPFAFSTAPTTELLAAYYAFYLKDILETKKIALLVEENTMFASSFADSLRIRLQEDGNIFSSIHYYGGDNTLDACIADVVATAPDAVVLCAIQPHAAVVAQKIHDADYACPLVGLHSRHGFNIRGYSLPASIPLHFLSLWNPLSSSPEAKAYIAAFTAFTGREPSEDDALVFDTITRLIHAIRQAEETSPKALQDSLAAQEYPQGVTEVYRRFNKDEVESVTAMTIIDGKKNFLKLPIIKTGMKEKKIQDQ